jgi:hypothetical protein
MVGLLTGLIKNGKRQAGIDVILLLSFVMLASSILFMGAGAIVFSGVR